MPGPQRRLAGAVLEPISDHPLKAAGGVAALVAAAVTWLGVTASASTAAATGSTGASVTLSTVVAFAAAHPAYPAAIVVGLAVLLFAE